VADVGIVADILEFLPELAERVREEKCVPAKGGRS
jgi:electron transfer flavoprotein alpha subunit